MSLSLDDSYSAAGLPAPTSIPSIGAALTAEAHPNEVLEVLAEEARTVDDPDKWIADAFERWNHATNKGTFREQITHACEQNLRSHISEIRKQWLKDVSPCLTAAVQELREIAEKLPAAQPLDTETCLQHRALDSLGNARELLEKIGVILSVVPPIDSGRHLGPITGVLELVDFPRCQPAQMSELGGVERNPDPARDSIRSLADAASRHGCDAALIVVARGECIGATLSVLDSLADRPERYDRLESAFRYEIVSS